MIQCDDCKIKYAMCAAGQAFTKYICDKCKKLKMYGNTGVPLICFDCSKSYNICQRCGKVLI